MQHGRNVLQAV